MEKLWRIEAFWNAFLVLFHSQVEDRRHPPDSRIPFEYCYDMSPDSNTSLIPSMSLPMGGGSRFVVYDPIIIISTQSELVYCLAVVKSAELNIIGQNFMTGYRVVFDREKLILGWKKSDCYDIEDHNNAVPTRRHSDNVPPAVAAGLGDYPATDSSKKSKYNSQHSSASQSPLYNFTSDLLWISNFLYFVLFTCSMIIHLYGSLIVYGKVSSYNDLHVDIRAPFIFLLCSLVM